MEMQYGKAPAPRFDDLQPVLPLEDTVDCNIIIAFCVFRKVLYDGFVLFPLWMPRCWQNCFSMESLFRRLGVIDAPGDISNLQKK